MDRPSRPSPPASLPGGRGSAEGSGSVGHSCACPSSHRVAVVITQRCIRGIYRACGPGSGPRRTAVVPHPPPRRPVAMSDGNAPSAAWMRCTTSHSPPLAEWTVDKVNQSSSNTGFPARSPVELGGSRVRSGQEGVDPGIVGSHPRQGVQIGEAGFGVVVVAPDHRLEDPPEELDPGSRGRVSSRHRPSPAAIPASSSAER